jgi:hypothetical protein
MLEYYRVVHDSLKPARPCEKATNTALAVLRQVERNFHYRDRNVFVNIHIPTVQTRVVGWIDSIRIRNDSIRIRIRIDSIRIRIRIRIQKFRKILIHNVIDPDPIRIHNSTLEDKLCQRLKRALKNLPYRDNGERP